ncbi:hypothetical protein PI124_g23694 [Phytophthora idaei]|nr:hypothetical protein PI125_g25926 [Phytophthora idaei]KAG3123426.1 hypothetical protein PI126_g23715 [Phytophthora idaei]KAG3231210.1 hypothetical protein PI124_g23694 [Phytophthora idaei]
MLEDLAVSRRPAELAFQEGNPALRRMICGSARLGDENDLWNVSCPVKEEATGPHLDRRGANHS